MNYMGAAADWKGCHGWPYGITQLRLTLLNSKDRVDADTFKSISKSKGQAALNADDDVLL
jgi:hypothetical protein